MLHRLGHVGLGQPTIAADVAGGAAIRVIVQKQQDVDFQLVQPMAGSGGFKLRCVELFVVLYKGQYRDQMAHLTGCLF